MLWAMVLLGCAPGSVWAQVNNRLFRSTSGVTIGDGVPADPYPSSISVADLPGVVSRVTVTLVGLSHTFPDDIDALLVTPTGQALLLMSDTGGSYDLNNVTLTFDDTAASSLPNSSQIVSGVYRPTNFDSPGTTDIFPMLPPVVTYVTNLSDLNGLFPNGTWSLYIVDDAGSDAGALAGGWILRLSTVDPASAADLAVSLTDAQDPLATDEKLLYTVTVVNRGPNQASGVMLTDVLPPSVEFLFASASQGSCAHTNGVVTCDLGLLANGETAAVTIGVAPTISGIVTNRVSVSGSTADFNPANSFAVETTTLTDATAVDLALSMTDAPDPVVVGQSLSYTITVTNRGTLPATDVVLSDTLPQNVTFLSASASQGSCSPVGNMVVCVLGNVTNGGQATATIAVRPNLVGSLTNTASVTASEFDVALGNNSTAAVTGVFIPTDVGVRQTDSMDPAAVGSNLTYSVFVYNNGPGAATGIVLSNNLPQQATLVSVALMQGSCFLLPGGVLICDLGSLPPTTSTRVQVTVRPGFLGTFINTATVSANESDPNPSNNTSSESTTVYPGGNGIVITPSTNAVELANAITAGGGTGIRVTSTRLQAHSIPGFTNFFTGEVTSPSSSGLYSVVNPPFTYGLRGLGVILSSGSVQDYATGPNLSSGNTTGYGDRATTNQEALLDPITASGGRTFTHYDVTQLDIEFDLLPGFDSVEFNCVFGSEEYPEFVNSSFVDGFGIYLNGVNIAFTGGKPININHSDMRALTGTELDGVIAPGGNPIMKFTKFLGSGAANNRLTFIISDTSDSVLDTTVFVSSLQGALPPNADLVLDMTGPTNFVTVGSNVTYRIMVTNLGPDVASETTLSNTLPAGAAFVSAVPSQGSCTFVGDQVICDLFNVEPGNTATVTLTISPTEEGPFTNKVSVIATQVDFGPTNNAAVSGTIAVGFGNYLATAAIIVNDGAPATPYPDTIVVSGVSGVITQMTVALKNLSHSFPADLDVLLVGPGGESVILMSDAGANLGINDVTLTFDDRAAQSLPRNAPITSDTYRPTNYDPPDLFPLPAPVGPYGSSLSAFKGTDPNGTWSLYVYDDLGQDAGLVFGGWRLTLKVDPAAAVAFAAPLLTIGLVGNQAVLSWPAQAAGYRVEATDSLSASAAWAPLMNPIVAANGRNTVTVDVPPGARFFRLNKSLP